MKRAWWIVAWVAATAVVSFVTLQTLSLAEAGIGDADLLPVVVASSSPVGAPDTTAVPDDGSTTTTSMPRRSDVPESTTTAVTPTSTAGTAQTSSTSTSPPPPTTVAVAAPVWEARTVQSGGGTVTVRAAPGAVEFVSAVPAPGFAVEVDDDGPTRVRVEFESDAERFEVRIEWDGSELVISID